MEKTKIEWCDSTWNPVTGCYHHCEYCYARRTANRYKGCLESPEGSTKERVVYLEERRKAEVKKGGIRYAAYPYGFVPTFHEYRLEDLTTKGFGKTIFVCSMADLFGVWIPDEWIIKVFEACKKADNHRYLFLTKNPVRYFQLAEKGLLPELDNFWYGTTATTDAEEIFYSNKHHTFASFEPIMSPFEKEGGDFLANSIEWAIIGAETGNRKNKVVPEYSWFINIVNSFERAGKPVLMKDSVKEIAGPNFKTEFPWSD